MTSFTNLDDLASEAPQIGFSYKGETYVMRDGSVGDLLDVASVLSKSAEAAESEGESVQDDIVQRYISMILNWFPDIDEDTVLSMSIVQMKHVMELILNPPESDSKGGAKKNSKKRSKK